MSLIVDSFSGEYRFLSNFWPVKVMLDGEWYSSVEHAYVAAKTKDKESRKKICEMTPGQAKRFGRTLELRSDWDEIKLEVMMDLLIQKFDHEDLKMKLYDTIPFELIEGNNWNDTFWGICKGVGHNHLGKMLMIIRDEIGKENE